MRQLQKYILYQRILGLISTASCNESGRHFFFLLPFHNVNYRYEQLFKIFCSGQKQQTTQSTARADHWKPHENAKSWLVQKWYHTCVDKNGIATRENRPWSFFSSCYHSVYNSIWYNKVIYSTRSTRKILATLIRVVFSHMTQRLVLIVILSTGIGWGNIQI